MLNNKKVVFLTGATGFVGSYMTTLLLQNNVKVICLGRKKDNKSISERIINAVRFWTGINDKKPIGNLRVLEGDVRKFNLGLNKRDMETIYSNVDEIFHFAAVTDFKKSPKEFDLINREGVENLLQFATKIQKMGRLKRVNHISTIYICGDSYEKFDENTLDVGQKFVSVYEKSKFDAEKIIRSNRNRKLVIDIFRLPAVIGHSLSGKTPSFNQGFYHGLRVLNSEVFESLPCKSLTINVAHIDEICKSIFCILKNKRDDNQCYHIFPSQPDFLDEILVFASKILRINTPKFIDIRSFLDLKPTSIQLNILKYSYLYLIRNAKIDSIWTNKILFKNKFLFSKLNEQNITRILNFAITEGYLRRKD